MKIPGIYVEVRGDIAQLKKDMRQARQYVTEQARDMSNAMNNALSDNAVKRMSNSFLSSFNTLKSASRASFHSISTDLKEMQQLTGLTASQWSKLQNQMMKTQVSDAQVRALRNIARDAGLSNREIRVLGRQFGLTGKQIDSATNSVRRFGKEGKNSSDIFSSSLVAAAAKVFILASALERAAKAINNIAFKFNATMEIANLSIASSLVSAGSFVDQMTGKTLEGVEALKAAQKDAKVAVEELKAANMQTIGTLEQLVRAYQETLPVALRVGFDKSQVLQFTTAMLQAAGAVDSTGQLMSMLGEETRSILTGAINPRTSRIAMVLGIGNEDIRKLKGDVEGLFNFVMDRLSAYQAAGVELQNTWSGLVAKTRDVFLQTSGMAFEPLFEMVKIELKDILDSMVVLDETTKQLRWSDDFMDGIESIKQGIVAIIAESYRLGMLLDKIGGTLTQIGAIATFGSWDAKFRQWNDMYEQRYREGDKRLEQLANISAGLNADGAPKHDAGKKTTFIPRKGKDEEGATTGARADWNAARSAEVEYLKAVEERKFAILKASLDAQAQLNENAYDLGLKDYKSYLQAKNKYAEEELAEDLKNKRKQLEAAQAAAGQISSVTDKEGNTRPDKTAKANYDALKKVETAQKAVIEAEAKLRQAQVQGAHEAIKANYENARSYKQITIELMEMRGNIAGVAQERAALDEQSVERMRLIADASAGIAGAQEALDASRQMAADRIKLAELDEIQRKTEALLGIAEINNEYERTLELRMRLIDVEIEAARLRSGEPDEVIAHLQAQRAEIEQMTTAAGAFAKGWKDATADFASEAKRMESLARDVASSMHDSFSNFFFDVLENDMKSFMDYFKSFLSSLNRALADYWAKTLISGIGGGASWLSSVVGGAGAAAGAMHTGGIVGLDQPQARIVNPAIFNGAKRYHSGLMPDEYPAILQKGEGVFTQGQMRALGGMLRSGRSDEEKAPQSVAINVPVNVQSEQGKAWTTGLKREIEDTVERYVRRAAV